MGENKSFYLSMVRDAVIMCFASTLFLASGCERKQEQASPTIVTAAKVGVWND